jgi:hypothetical protein
MKTLLLALLMLAAGAAPAQSTSPATQAAPGTTRLTGTVRDAAGQPLPGVNVFLKTTFDGASTDSLGRFDFRTDHAAGPLTLVATFVGYEPLELPVTLGQGPISLPNLQLKASRAALGDVVVTAGAFEASDEKRSSVLKPLDIVTTAGALGDVAGALNALPGTTRVGEEGRLFVRGGAASETKYYLDGLPVQTPYGGSVPNVAARGRFSPFLFKGLVFSTGGYSAEYGQALSAVVVQHSTDLAPETQSGLSLMAVGGSASRTKRWNRTSVDVSADYTNLAPYYHLVPQSLGWERAPLALGGSLKLAHRTGAAGMLKLYGTYSRQRLDLRQPNPQPRICRHRPPHWPGQRQRLPQRHLPHAPRPGLEPEHRPGPDPGRKHRAPRRANRARPRPVGRGPRGAHQRLGQHLVQPENGGGGLRSALPTALPSCCRSADAGPGRERAARGGLRRKRAAAHQPAGRPRGAAHRVFGPPGPLERGPAPGPGL